MTTTVKPGLLTALLAVQQDAPTLPKDATNPHFRSKYTPLDTIVEHIGPILNKHGLVWMTKPGSDDRGEPVLRYTLAHAPSGEREEGEMPLLLSKADPQGMGSAITYARRYSLCAVLNLVADEDDDGNAGSQNNASAPARANGNKPSQKQRDLIKSLSTQKAVLVPQLRQMVREITLTEDVEINEGWVDRYLTGGKEGSASALIDRLMNGPIPEAPAPLIRESDAGEPAQDEFVHTPSGDTSPVPIA